MSEEYLNFIDVLGTWALVLTTLLLVCATIYLAIKASEQSKSIGKLAREVKSIAGSVGSLYSGLIEVAKELDGVKGMINNLNDTLHRKQLG